jgi:preprotein translocase subunit SecE
MAKDQAPSAPLSGRGGRNIGRGAAGKPPARSGGGQTAVDTAAPKKAGFNPVRWITNAPQFFKEVRAEARKTTWTSPKETWITSVMVFIMVVLATLFFFGVDWAVSMIVQQVIKIGA